MACEVLPGTTALAKARKWRGRRRSRADTQRSLARFLKIIAEGCRLLSTPHASAQKQGASFAQHPLHWDGNCGGQRHTTSVVLV